MKHLVKTTHYWLFERAHCEYYHVRCKTDGIDAVYWFMGRVDNKGFVIGVGPSYSDELSAELEKRFSETPVSELE